MFKDINLPLLFIIAVNFSAMVFYFTKQYLVV